MLLNELIIKKLDIFDCAFIEISVLYSNNKTKFVISLVPDTRLITWKELNFDKNFTQCIYWALLLSESNGHCCLEPLSPLFSCGKHQMCG